ncbi:MAG: HDOD domain-containing protein [Planctomycetota bacterium]
MPLKDRYAAAMASDRLPTPGPVAMELAALSRRPDADFDEVARVVATDPALCARVMRAANTVARGARAPTASLERALMALGLRAIARIALETSVLDSNRSGLAEFDYGAFWAESLARAVAAQVVATQVAGVQPDEAFTYGLLAGIGRLALVSVWPDTYRKMLLALRTVDPSELAEAEAAVFDIDAQELSARMLFAWGLPALSNAARQAPGRDPATARREDATVSVCGAGALLARLMVHQDVDREALRHAMRVLGELGIGTELASHLFPDLVERFEVMGPHLGIATPPVASLAELYSRASQTSRPS